MMQWGPKEQAPNPEGLRAAIAPDAEPNEMNQSDLEEALKQALAKAEMARKAASEKYQQQVLDENEKRNG
jgi:hypothetical protein